MTAMNPAWTSLTKAGSSILSANPNRSERRWTVRSASDGSQQRSTSSRSRRVILSGGSPGSIPARSPMIAATGEKVAVSVYDRGWPRRTTTAAPTPAPNSSARRDLPIPGSPTTVTSTGRPVEVARPRLWSRMACSPARPTKGIVRRAERVLSPSTGKASIASSKPFARTRRRRPNETMVEVRAWVVRPARSCPGWAEDCSRAATFTTGPVTSTWPLGLRPSAASPDPIPIRTSSGSASPAAWPRRRARARMARPARTARRASSSWTAGSPKTAITASPMNFSGRPRSASSSSAAAPKNWPRTSRARSASSLRPSPVESTMSAKRTVTILRSSVPTSGPTAAPQFGQNRAPSGSGRPQTAHVMTIPAEYAARHERSQDQGPQQGPPLLAALAEGAGIRCQQNRRSGRAGGETIDHAGTTGGHVLRAAGWRGCCGDRRQAEADDGDRRLLRRDQHARSWPGHRHYHDEQAFEAAGDESRTVSRRHQGQRRAVDQGAGRDGRTPACRHAREARIGLGPALPQLLDRLGDPARADVGGLDLEGRHQALLGAVGQPHEEFLGLGVAIERGREGGRQLNFTRLRVQLEVYVDHVSARHAGSLADFVADSEHERAAHDRDGAAVRIAVAGGAA